MDDRTHTNTNARVRAIVDDAIAELVMVGLESRSAAANLMAIQAIIRIEDEDEIESLIKFVADTYRGVHTAGEVYDVGDMVTCGGSLWHCNEITDGKPGEATAAWTLAVKRGRDGKDITRAAA